MDLHTLSDQIETNLVNNENGWGQSITYKYRATSAEHTINAFCQDGDYRNIQEDDVDGDLTSFLSVELPSIPKTGDTITFNNQNWFVIGYTGNNLYDITTTSNMKLVGGRSRKRP